MWTYEVAAWTNGSTAVGTLCSAPVAETPLTRDREIRGEGEEQSSERPSTAGAAEKTPPPETTSEAARRARAGGSPSAPVEGAPAGEARQTWPQLYRSALQAYLSTEGEAELHEAYRLGRRAIGDGLGLLDLSAHHHRAVSNVLAHRSRGERPDHALDAALRFFTEVLSPYEMVHLGFQQAQEMLRRVNETLEQQAKQIARALHDEAGQLLATVHLALDDVKSGLPPEYAGELERVRALLFQIEDELRRLSHELRPPALDDLGLLPALGQLAENVTRRTGLTVTVDGSTASDDADGDRLPPAVETALYRIIQESLTNATRHARAARVTVAVRRDVDGVGLTVEDDGIGFDPTARAASEQGAGLGLAGIRERLAALNGRLEIRSAPGAGTCLRAWIPVPR